MAQGIIEQGVTIEKVGLAEGTEAIAYGGKEVVGDALLRWLQGEQSNLVIAFSDGTSITLQPDRHHGVTSRKMILDLFVPPRASPGS